MSLKYEISGVQDDGARDYQEDSFLSSHLHISEVAGQTSLIIVADGMGGHAAGNVASNLAVQSFNKYITSNYPSDSIHNLLKDGVDEANKAITKAIKETSALKGMGCTLVAALCINDKMYWVSVGDSHLFHMRDKQLIKRNADHSYGGYLDRMAAEGNEINEENGYSRHMLLSALTGEPIPAIDCPDLPVSLKEGDQLLLCSDGIDTIDQKRIQETSNLISSAKELAKKLLSEVSAEDHPRQDNTTIVAVSVLSASSEAKKETEFQLSPTTEPPEITSFTPQTAIEQERPRSYATETTSHRNIKSNGSIGSWILPTLLLLALAVGGWWYLQQTLTPNTEAIVMEAQPEETVVGTAIDENVEIQDQIQNEPHTKELVKFADKIAKGGSGPEMVWVPKGQFNMGGTGSTSLANERPNHSVEINEFAISTKEVTRGEFSKFSGVSVSNANKNHPVQNVSWKTAKRYTKWLSKQTGKTYRLPTESEWEYAARAGTSSPFWWGYKLGADNALCFGCTSPLEPTRPTATASFKANDFGLFDTTGNVAEWVEDCYHDNYENAPADGSSWMTKGCQQHVVRGGAFLNAGKALFVSRRDKLSASKSEKHIGFRIAREK